MRSFKIVLAVMALILLAVHSRASQTGLVSGDEGASGGVLAPYSGPSVLPEGENECGKGAAAPCPKDTGVTDPGGFLTPGRPAPALSVLDQEGKPSTLDPRAVAKPVLIIFWSLFCEPCKEEFPFFSYLESKYSPKGLFTMSVNLDGTDYTKAMKSYLKMNRTTMPVSVDRKEGKRFVSADAYGVTGTPSIFLMDAGGIVRWSHAGRVDPDRMEGEIKNVLGM